MAKHRDRGRENRPICRCTRGALTSFGTFTTLLLSTARPVATRLRPSQSYKSTLLPARLARRPVPPREMPAVLEADAEELPSAPGILENKAGGAPQESVGEGEESGGVLLHGLPHRPPANAGEGVCDFQLHPSAVRPRLRHHLHRVDESLGSARAPGPAPNPPG